LGAPGGLKNQVLDQTVTRGIISAIRLIEAPYNPSEKIQFIQTDAAINPGNSGGPLINEKGEVIGVNSQKIVREAVEGLNFAISIEEVKKSFSEYLR
jgi:serine protease Do